MATIVRYRQLFSMRLSDSLCSFSICLLLLLDRFVQVTNILFRSLSVILHISIVIRKHQIELCPHANCKNKDSLVNCWQTICLTDEEWQEGSNCHVNLGYGCVLQELRLSFIVCLVIWQQFEVVQSVKDDIYLREFQRARIFQALRFELQRRSSSFNISLFLKVWEVSFLNGADNIHSSFIQIYTNNKNSLSSTAFAINIARNGLTEHCTQCSSYPFIEIEIQIGEYNNKMQVQNRPRLYADVNRQMEDSYHNYEAYELQYGSISNYEIITKIGKGKYSEVYTGMYVGDDTRVVIKVLKPVKKSKMKRQIKILQALTGHPGIIELKDVIKDPASKTTCLIFDHLDNIDFRSLIPTMTDIDCRFYLYELLKALNYCHSKGIMHRDVKPQNIIINPAKRIIKLIDWGLAEFYHMGQDYNVRVASRYFKGPELLIDYNYYDYSLDIWSVGCVFASMIFKQEPFFMGESNRDQLVKICQVLGTDGLFKYVKKYHLKLDEEYINLLGKLPARPWTKFVKPDNKMFCSEEALDLLSKMLVFDHAERILPKEALEHKYFEPVRN